MRLQIQPFCMELTEIRIHYVAVCHQTQPQPIFSLRLSISVCNRSWLLSLAQFLRESASRHSLQASTLTRVGIRRVSRARNHCLLFPNDSHIYTATQRKQLKHLPDDVFFRLSTSLFLPPSLPSSPISFLEFCFLQQPLCCQVQRQHFRMVSMVPNQN